MRKILTFLGSIAVSGISTTSVVSCIAPQYAGGEQGERVIVSTDGGRVDDHSFNQDAYIGMRNYVNDAYELDGSRNYVEAKDSSHTSIVSGYRLAKLKKADAVVLPGFSHMSTIKDAAMLFDQQTIVLIDGVPPDKSDLYKHVISVLFNSQLAGMQAGFDTAYWATSKNDDGSLKGDVNNDNKITIGTFAGASNKYGVDNYNWGLLLGIELFNEYYKDQRSKVMLANTDDGLIDSVKIQNTTSTDWWTNGFDLGGANKTGIVAKLIDKRKADIIFPVAGPQIEDVLSYQPRDDSFTRLPYVIGVDVDQAAIYNTATNHGRFITSATKNIHSATKAALEHASSLKNKSSDGNLYARSGDELWDGTSPKRYRNWSVDLLDSQNNGNYKLKKHKLRLFDGENGTNPDEAGATQVSDDDKLINFVNDAFANSGDIANQYLNGKLIQNIAKEILTKVANKEFDLVYND